MSGLIITLLIVLAIIGSAQEKEVAGFMGVWLSIWTAGCYPLLIKISNAWKNAAVPGSGLQLYLSVAEKERLNLLNPPEKTPELFEKFLPWALALDVEQQWSEQFSDLLARAGQEDSYAPSWYSGRTSFATSSLASSLGSSLAASISSSSTAPGSSSGSGGGGSSGGGGGGGGGGGW